MNQLLKQQLQNLPTNPGIYQFFNHKDELLYIGKAKNLLSRVNSYFRKGDNLTPTKKLMVQEISYLKTISVDNNNEALILESQLIRERQPKYNIIFKDDKNWLWLSIDYQQKYPRVELTRQINKRRSNFGPYTSAASIRQSFHLLQKILGFRTCQNPPEQPCFDSTLGRCFGHDLKNNNQRSYNQRLSELKLFLTGRSDLIKNKLQRKMKLAARQRQFELAAKIRDQLKLLERILLKQKIILPHQTSLDIIGLAREKNSVCIGRLIIRSGRYLDSEFFLLDQKTPLTDPDIIGQFLDRYYHQATDKPKIIIVPTLPQEATLKINLSVAQRGLKKQLQQLANKNAQQYLNNSFASWQKRNRRAQNGLSELQKILKLKNIPRRIEAYDISNIQGKYAVGSMVVMTNGLLDKKQYRKFTIKHIGPNDVAMMAEMLTRRFHPNNIWSRPDLIILDGGKPQLNTIIKLFKNKKINLNLVALAKKQEELFLPHKKRALKLPADSTALLLLRQLRDEAHRFGITFYRQKHNLATTHSFWQELPSIGPKLRKKLKKQFGTVTNLKQTNIQNLSKILGLTKAKKLISHLQANGY